MKEGVSLTGKKCSRCGEVKALEGFHNSKASKDGKGGHCKACTKARLSTPEMKEKRKNHAWKACLKRFNLSEADYDAMFERQMGLCAICHKPETGGIRLAVDHDHNCCPNDGSCGNCIRGLLCKRCNMGIGLLGDNPDIMTNALLYLKGSE